jgi:PAS domain S-box-containing protein
VAVVLAWLFAGMTGALVGLLLLLRRDRRWLKEAERRGRLGTEHARLHLSVLARASDEMASALESYDDALVRLVGVVVPFFADWFAVDLVDESGEVHRVCAGDREGVASPGSAHRHPEGDVLVRRVIESGRHVALAKRPGDAGTHEGELVRDGRSQVSAVPGIESMVIVPVHVRGLAFGALSFVTLPGRRGYRLSDLETAHGLADRVAVAIERVLLWRESRRAEQAAIGRADQLHRLMEAALAVNAPLAEREILGVAADHARRVLGAERASMCTVPRTDEGEMIVVCSPEAAAEELGEVVPAACDLVVEFGRPLRSVAAPPERAGGHDPHDPRDPRDPRDPHDPHDPRAPRDPRLLLIEGVPEGARVDPSRVPSSGGPWVAVPVPGPVGDSRRVMVVEGAHSVGPVVGGVPASGFSYEDESVLVLLAQMVSVALVNGRLYQDVRASERRLRAVVESSPLAIAELAVNGDARWWNRAADVLLGCPQADGAQRAPKQMPVHPESHAAWRDLLERSSQGISSVGTDVRAMGPGDQVIELSVSSAPLLDDERQVSGILVVAEDVTERRRVLEHMHQSERFAAMAHLAGGVAHDFNNFLTVILGSTDLLSRRSDLDVSWREEIEAIQRAGQQAAAVTAQLLAIGRHREVELTVLDLDAELPSMLPMLERVLGDDVQIELAPTKSGARILVGPADLERAVLNLAINARDAMPEGGRFRLSTRVVESERIPGEMGYVQGKLVALSVTDTGEGMDEQTAERCFEPFFSTKPEDRGTGLGLFAVHAIVTQAGGRVSIDTAPHRGTTFTMWFPVLDERGEPSKTAS